VGKRAYGPEIGYNRGVTNSLSEDLTESLTAAYEARRDIHFDICTVYTRSPEFGCSCGVPRLLADLAAALLGQRETAGVRAA
jgi:hypothetical protein